MQMLFQGGLVLEENNFVCVAWHEMVLYGVKLYLTGGCSQKKMVGFNKQIITHIHIQSC